MSYRGHEQNQALPPKVRSMVAQPFDAETQAARLHIRRANRIAR
jgi:hypothetical protein